VVLVHVVVLRLVEVTLPRIHGRQTKGFDGLRAGMLPVVRPLTLFFATLLTVWSLTACTSDAEQAAPVVAAELPDDLCAAVPDTMVSRWNLQPSSHETDNSDDLSTAACTMTGEIAGDTVDLELSLRAFGAPDDDTADALARDSLDESCGELENQTVEGEITEAQDSCTWQSPEAPQNARGQVQEASLVLTFPGVARVTMSHAGRQWQLVPAEVVALGARLTQAKPSELTGS